MTMRALMRQFLVVWKGPRWRWALMAALASDGVGLALVAMPPAYWALDVVTVVLLFALLGFRWALLPALIVEAVPGLQVFPAWTLVVAALAATQDKGTQDHGQSAQGPASQPKRHGAANLRMGEHQLERPQGVQRS